LTEPTIFPKIYQKDACGIKNNVSSMIKIPSYTASILTGIIIMPLSTMVTNYAEERHYSQFIIILWSVIGFMMPLMLATVDIGYIRKNGLFTLRNEDFKLFYIPAWKRMLVLFIATVCSVIILKQMGLNI